MTKQKAVTGEGNAPRVEPHGAVEAMEKVWVVARPSAYRYMHICLLGRGATKQSALEDAFGPKADWNTYIRRNIRECNVYETNLDAVEEMECNQ